MKGPNKKALIFIISVLLTHRKVCNVMFSPRKDKSKSQQFVTILSFLHTTTFISFTFTFLNVNCNFLTTECNVVMWRKIEKPDRSP